MRKLILAPMALACMLGAAQAQQQQTTTSDQGKPGAAAWPVTWTGQAVLADLRVAGSPVAVGNAVPVSLSIGGAANASANPIFVQVTNQPASQAVTNAGTFAVQNTASTPAGTNSIGTVGLNAGTNAIGTVVVTSLPPLPAGANNIGTIGNAFALDATVTARLGTLGQKASAGSTPVVIASDQSAVKTDGSGVTQPVSAATLPLPAGAATSALQSAVRSAPGTSAGTAVTIQGASAGVAIPVSGTFYQPTQPISAVALPLPAGAATAANQSSEIAALGGTGDAAYGGSGTASIIAALKGLYATTVARSTYFSEARSQSVAASAAYGGTFRDGGASPSPWAKFNINGLASQSGTLAIFASDAANGNAAFQIGSQVVTAGVAFSASVPNLYRSYQAVFVNGSAAATLTMSTGFTAN